MAAMLRDLRGLARESAIYGLSTVLGRLIGFILTPLFSHLLTPAENGVVQSLYSLIAFLAVVYGLGLDTAYLRLGRRDGRGDSEAFASAFGGVAACAAALTLLAAAFARPLAVLLGLPGELAPLVRLAAAILAVDALMIVPYAELRGSHRAGAYAGVKLASVALNLVLAVVFVRGLGLGVRGVFMANLVASCSALAMLAPVLASRVAPPSLPRLKEMLAFGLPLVAAGFGSMIVSVADRPILAALSGLSAAGVYGTCYKLGIGMMLLVGMFDQAWKPFILERAHRPDAPALIARVLTYFAAAACWAFLAIAFFAEPLATAPLLAGKPLIHESYWGGLGVVPVVSLGYLFNGLYFVMLAPLLIDKRTAGVGAAAWIGAAVNLAANFALIPRLGGMGAAWATLAAYAAMALSVWAISAARSPVPCEWGRLALLAGWTAALWWPASLVSPQARVVLWAAYPVGLAVSGFAGKDEVDELKALFGSRT